MFESAKSGASAYAAIGIETGVLVASPHKLIVMLFDGALLSVTMGLQHMKEQETEKKGMAISRAIWIIDGGLRASLDKQAGGEIAANLDALYAYISGQLLMGNIKNQPALLEEAHALLTELRAAWNAIASKQATDSVDTDAPALQRVSA